MSQRRRKTRSSASVSLSAPVASTSANAAVDADTFYGDGGERSQERVGSQGQMNPLVSSQMHNLQIGEDTSSSEEEEEYGSMHRLVLQGVMAAGFLDAKGVKKLFHEAAKHLNFQTPSEQDFLPYIQKVVREINQQIKFYDMMVKSAVCEITGEKFYMFLMTVEKPILKLQTHFSKPELSLFQKILDVVLRKEVSFTMSTTACLNLVTDVNARGFTKENAQEFVDRLITLKYLVKVYNEDDKNKPEKDRDFNITIGFRTIREFESLFRDRDVYGDIFGNCCLCKTILLNGLQCLNCSAVIHRTCLKKYIRSCQRCPSCKESWKDERALTVRVNTAAENHTSVRNGPSTSEATENNESDEDDDKSVTDAEAAKNSAPPSARARRATERDSKSKRTPAAPTRASKRKAAIHYSSDESD